MWAYVGLALVLVALPVGWVLTLAGMPGNWLIVGSVALYAWLVPEAAGRIDIGWPTVVALALLAATGEALEFFTGAWGARQAGGSRRSAVLAIVGSIVGAILGGMVGLPVPVVGSLVGIVLGSCLGALVGGVLGETWKGRTLDQSLQVGQGAFVGRFLGTLAKILVSSAMVATTLVAALWG